MHMTWIKGEDINPSLNRNGLACSVAGDNFVAWGGGQSGKYVSSLEAPVIYNLKSNLWTNQFTGTTDTPSNNPGNPTGTPSPIDTSGKDPNVAIIGGIAGGSVLVVAFAFFMFKRCNSSKKPKDDDKAYSYAAMGINPDFDNNGQYAGVNLHDNVASYEQVPIRMQPLSQRVDQFPDTPNMYNTPIMNANTYSAYSIQQDSASPWDVRYSHASDTPLYIHPQSDPYRSNATATSSFQSSASTIPPLPNHRPINNPHMYLQETPTYVRNPQDYQHLDRAE
ncbi:hypothetical protein BGX27_011272 [Mortierella sp. AM989]|nr:hypothetical protein BGX27_011272 [Mortierella sp. AM989]